MAALTLDEANPHIDPAVQFNPLLQWHRERPSQVAFAVSIVLHGLLIAFVPGLRSVSIEPQRVLSVRISEPAPAVEHPLVREFDRLPPPEFEPTPEFEPRPEFDPRMAQPLYESFSLNAWTSIK